jgi:hypothetical protein
VVLRIYKSARTFQNVMFRIYKSARTFQNVVLRIYKSAKPFQADLYIMNITFWKVLADL